MRDRLFAAPKTILLGSCIALAVLVVTACGGGAEKSGAPAVTDGEPGAPPAATEEASAPAVAAEEPDAPAVAAEESSVPAAADEEAGAPAVATETSAPAVAETPAYGAPDAPEVDASQPQVDAPPSEEAGIAEAEAIETPAPPEEPVVEPRVTALHDGVPVDRKTVGFEEATVEIIDFSDFQ